MPEAITVRGARLHNLKNITISIPKNKLVVFTGLSGSGKSTLGFDILLKEGQRQYLESLGLITFGFAKPPVDAITGLSPAISVDQHLTNHSPRSTVGTSTEVFTYLRVLFARLGHRACPNCGQKILPSYNSLSAGWEGESVNGDEGGDEDLFFPCPHCGQPVAELNMANFSFNKPAGACPTCTGLGTIHQANISRLVDEQKSLPDGAVVGWETNLLNYYTSILMAAAKYYGFTFDLNFPVKDDFPSQRDLLFHGVSSPVFRRHFPGIEPPETTRQGRFEGIAINLLRRYAERIEDAEYRDKLSEFLITQTCPDCVGTRLKPESRAVTINGETIIALSSLPLTDLHAWLTLLPETLTTDEMVFDQPTIGIHQRDTHRMIEVLRQIRDLGNTVLVIEHDLEMIASADYLVDFGPGAGKHGGQIVAAGLPVDVKSTPGSITGDYLAGRATIPYPQVRRRLQDKSITITGACHNNLKNLTIRFPLGLLVAVTGVSGSGKSSLVFDILDRAIRQRLYPSSSLVAGGHDAIEGLEFIDKVITLDQEHIGRIPRSNAATYSDSFTPIREAFAATLEARTRGLSPCHFSFNVPGGRCERCQGTGVLTVSMHFLPEVEVRCPVCHGRRFTTATLEILYRDHNISQVLDLTVEEALLLFADVPAARSRLQLMADVGLGYLPLGQPATTLSGGEAQRVKLARELGRRGKGHTLYLLDEPTTGLHLADTARLLGVLQRLVDAGNSVILVEHNLELVKAADWIIDLGPEGGAAGGRLMAEGTPEQVAQVTASFTGQYLRKILGKPGKA